MTNNLKNMTAETFQQYIATDFIITLQDDDTQPMSYIMTLAEVERVGEKDRDVAAHGRESFSLIFKNPNKEQYLHQGTYSLQHPELGIVTLFVVPLGPRDEGMYYEVIFT